MRTVFLDFDSLHPGDLDTAALEAALSQIEYFGHSNPDELGGRLKDAEVVVVNKIRLGASEFENAPALKLICLAATGSDNIDLDAARENNIAVANIRDYCTASVAQHVFTLILTLTQRLDTYRHQVRAGDWAKSTQFCLLEPTFDELEGKTLGIVGYGTLGKRVAEIGAAFGMRVVAAIRKNGTPSSADDVTRLPLEELLEHADVISLHCPLNEATHHLIDANTLRRMQRHAILINTARGGLIDSTALVEALLSGAIRGAGIDVLAEEPPVNGDALLDALADNIPTNLIVTPHVAWAAREARQRALDQILGNIEAFAAGSELNRLV